MIDELKKAENLEVARKIHKIANDGVEKEEKKVLLRVEESCWGYRAMRKQIKLW